MVTTSPIARRKEVGALLREHRTRVGMTVTEAAAALDMSQAKLSRLERGERGLQLNDVRALCVLYRIDVDETSRLLAMARESRERGWWSDYSELESEASVLYGLEAAASSSITFETMRIPGLMQTPEYAKALLRGLRPPGEWDADVIDTWVAARTQRQGILADDTKHFEFFIDESALRRVVGGPAVMAEQLEGVVAAAARDNVDVRLLPFSAGPHPGLDGSFTLMRFDSGALADTVFVEGLAGRFFFESEAHLSLYAQVAEALSHTALSEDDSVMFLRVVARDWAEHAGDEGQQASLMRGGAQ